MRPNVLQLAGKPRNQEASRKLFVRHLKGAITDALRAARKAEKLVAYFDCTIDELKAKPPMQTRRALAGAVHLGLSWSVGRLLGIEPARDETNVDYHRRLSNLIYGLRPTIRGASSDEPRSRAAAVPEAQHVPFTSATDPVAAAMRIVAEARDATAPIDWSNSPTDDNEARLRLAIIRRIEVEKSEMCARFGWPSAPSILTALRDLQPPDAQELGEDLYDAIERWEKAFRVERAQTKATEARRLIEQARKDLEI